MQDFQLCTFIAFLNFFFGRLYNSIGTWESDDLQSGTSSQILKFLTKGKKKDTLNK